MGIPGEQLCSYSCSQMCYCTPMCAVHLHLGHSNSRSLPIRRNCFQGEAVEDIVRKFRFNPGSGPTFTSPFGRRGLRSVGLQLQSSTGQVPACQLPADTGIPPPPSPLLFAFISCSTASSKPPALPHSDPGAAPTPWPPSPQGQVTAATPQECRDPRGKASQGLPAR